MNLKEINTSRLSNIELAKVIVAETFKITETRGEKKIAQIVDLVMGLFMFQVTSFEVLLERFRKYGPDPDALEIIRKKFPQKAEYLCQEAGVPFESQSQFDFQD
jgi:hypothetical protein